MAVFINFFINVFRNIDFNFSKTTLNYMFDIMKRKIDDLVWPWTRYYRLKEEKSHFSTITQ